MKVLSIDTTSSMEDLTLDIVTGLGLLDTKYYGIFQVDHEGGNLSHLLSFEIMIHDNIDPLKELTKKPTFKK
jgi:hypothetical protein